jgi:uncharacterized protein YgbK (DUF1537 family)
MIMGVVADDITGSNDIGIMFTKSGCQASVFNLPEDKCVSSMKFPDGLFDIGIINTNSRLDSAEEAYRKVFQATRYLEAQNCSRYFNKTCSVFRGNIGAEFDAMLDALCMDFGVVVLGFPKNGRTTSWGLHRVRGLLLEKSEFYNDPIHPMLTSDLAKILASQSKRKVGNIYQDIIESGADAVRERIDEMRDRFGYVILDVIDQGSLRIIAEAVKDEPVLCGSSALAEELPGAWGVKPPQNRRVGLNVNGNSGILCVAGSLMPQTLHQVQRLIDGGMPAFELDGLALFDEYLRESTVNNLISQLSDLLAAGKDSLLHSGVNQNQVEAIKEKGRALGLTDKETARLVSGSMSKITSSVMVNSGQNKLIVAGGETSDAVCESMNINGLKILEEIQPGLPSCVSIPESPGGRAFYLVLKSGSFGSDDFLLQALEHLRALD